MLALLLAPIYLIVSVYVLRWVFRFIEACFQRNRKNSQESRTKWIKVLFTAIYAFVCLTPLISFLMKESDVKRIISQIGCFWMGIFLYLVLIIILFDLIRWIIKKQPFLKRQILSGPRMLILTGCAVILLTAGITLYGTYNAREIRVTRYSVEIPSEAMNGRTMKIVLAADLHLGYSIGYKQAERMADLINAAEPDLVCLAGDIFDNQYDALDDPEKIREALSRIDSKYGVYACYGNHDYEEKILAGFTFDSEEHVYIGDKMRQLLFDAGIRTLEDETVLIDDSFYVVGRKDYSSRKKSGSGRMSADELLRGLDPEKPVIVIDHQPRELEELSSAGADLDLCGHTHDGQTFPGNIVTSLIWENSCGYLKKGGMHNIVTSGAGILGPYMRVGTKSEIVEINVKFIK